MTFKEFNESGIKLEEGVLITKYLMNIPLINKDNISRIKSLFTSHNYNIDVIPGAFIKIYTSNEKEIAELESILVEIEKLGLKDLFNINLKVGVFKKEFIERVKFCINNNLPYLNEDNTFVSALYNREAFGEYSATIPLHKIKTVQELNSTPENKLEKMDPEDKQVYNEIVTKLSYLVLANPTDEFLTQVINNIKDKIVEPILRKEYRFFNVSEIISNVMFDGLETTPVDNIRIEELILNTFPEQERKLS